VAERRFEIACGHCRTVIVGAARLVAADELETLLAHVRDCQPHVALPERPGVAEILRHFDVRSSE
jgi:hypothetical protein